MGSELKKQDPRKEQGRNFGDKGGACGKWAFINAKTGDIRMFLCGSRRCERRECKKIFWHKRVKLLDSLVKEHKLDYFFTLTLDPKNDRGLDPWSTISGTWSKFRKRMNRRYDDLKFVAILEAQKNGRPHIHGFWNHFISWEECREHWIGAGAGAGVYLEYVRTGGAAEYISKQLEVCKYVGKEQVIGVPLSVRRTIWRTKSLKASFELKKEGVWIIVKETVFNDDGVRKIDNIFPIIGGEYIATEKEQERSDMEAARCTVPF